MTAHRDRESEGVRVRKRKERRRLRETERKESGTQGERDEWLSSVRIFFLSLFFN